MFENSGQRLRVWSFLFFVLLGGAWAAQAATITVTSNLDTTAVDNAVTLREAIDSANANADVNADVTANRTGTYGIDTIAFAIPGAGVHTIAPASALPAITDTLTIDGHTQSGATTNSSAFGLAINAVLRIELDGTSAGAGVDGLSLIDHSGSVVRGLGIRDFGGDGVSISGTGGGHTVAGCFIGTSANGLAGAGNGEDGVLIFGVAGNTIGGTSPADRNLISDNGQGDVHAGVEIREDGADGNLVQGNYIGTDASGAVGLGNATAFGYGVILFKGASSSSIGGAAAGAGNVISDNGGGVSVQGSPPNYCDDNVIAGNRIGTNAAGTAALANSFAGISNVAYANRTVIGGTAAGAGNLISGNTTEGIGLGGTGGVDTRVEGNRIGTDVTGTVGLGNGTRGIRGSDDSGSAVIGGTAAGAGNIIAFNGSHGVQIRMGFSDPEGFAVLGNSIHDNAGLGIELAADGVTANDLGDADTGPNHLQNYPVVTAAVSNGVQTTVTGSLNSIAATVFRIEFFASAVCDASGSGEGATFLGATSVTTDGSGNASFIAGAPAPAIGVVTATATDPGNNTSEFSACQAVALVPDNAPIATGDAYATTTNIPLSVAAPGVLVNDSDPDSDPITAVLDASPLNGTLVLNPDGSFLYTPNAGYNGPDSFTYHATDGLLNSAIVTVQLTVNLPILVPALGGPGLVLLVAALAAAAVFLLRRH